MSSEGLIAPGSKDPDFIGKSAFVTGAGAGIGRAIALALARAGATTVLFDFSPAGLEESGRLIEAEGGETIMIQGNVTDRSAVFDAIARSSASLGSLDFAVNNAGILGDLTPLDSYPIERFKEVLDVNLMGVVHCLQAELQCMRAQGTGAIVNIASAGSLVGWPNASAYTASKHAVLGLTKTAAAEFAPHNIRINAVCPTFIHSELSKVFLSDKSTLDAVSAQIPLGRVGRPEEVAAGVLWLLSSKSSLAIGTGLVLDGGYTVL